MKNQSQKNHNDSGAKALILEAGIQLFSQKGYASTSVREIVEYAGVTKPVLYYYYQNKEGLFCKILDWAAEKQDEILAQVMKKPGNALNRMIYLSRRTYEEVMAQPNLFKLLHNLIFGPPQGAPTYDIERFHRNMLQTLATIYLEGVAKKELRKSDPEEVAMLVLSLIDFCFHMDYLYPETADPKRPERLLSLAYQGLHESNTHSNTG